MAVALCSLAIAQSPTLVTVSGPVYDLTGGPFAGSITPTLQAVTSNGAVVRSKPIKVCTPGLNLTNCTYNTLINGQFSLAMVSNGTASPAATSYTVVYAPSGGSSYTEYWSIPGPWIAHTVYQVGQGILDPNGNIQVVSVNGTSGSSAPSWNATVGGISSDAGFMLWRNAGPPTPALVETGPSTVNPNLTGPAGIQGIQGVQGAQGLQGTIGLTGATGSTGAQGTQGITGPTGAASTVAGPTGPSGAQGIQGIVGATGAASTVAGPSGPTGPQGSVGAASTVPGPTGSQGIQGIVGPTGAASTVAGPTGPAGPTPSGAANLILATPNGSSGTSGLRSLTAPDILAAGLLSNPTTGNAATASVAAHAATTDLASVADLATAVVCTGCTIGAVGCWNGTTFTTGACGGGGGALSWASLTSTSWASLTSSGWATLTH